MESPSKKSKTKVTNPQEKKFQPEEIIIKTEIPDPEEENTEVENLNEFTQPISFQEVNFVKIEPIDPNDKIDCVEPEMGKNFDPLDMCVAEMTSETDFKNSDLEIGLTNVNNSKILGGSGESSKTVPNSAVKKTRRLKKTYLCEICKKMFKKKSHLDRHVLTHAEKASYSCEICGRNFRYHHYFKKHSCDKPKIKKDQICYICGKVLNPSSNLKVHLRIHKEEKEFKCDICNQAFRQQGVLDRHKSIHSDERPFTCDICNKSFRCKNFMVRHKRIHMGVKTCECEFCGRCFIDNGQLARHRRIHTGEKPYQCDVCNKTFTRKVYLRDHKNTFHKDTSTELV